jgi:hypothetical protein
MFFIIRVKNSRLLFELALIILFLSTYFRMLSSMWAGLWIHYNFEATYPAKENLKTGNPWSYQSLKQRKIRGFTWTISRKYCTTYKSSVKLLLFFLCFLLSEWKIVVYCSSWLWLYYFCLHISECCPPFGVSFWIYLDPALTWMI